MRIMNVILVTVCLVNSAWANNRAPELVAVNPDDIEVRVEQVGSVPYPYQSLRLRVTVRNISSRRLGPPLLPVEKGLGSCLIKGPDYTEYWKVHPTLISGSSDEGIRCTAGGGPESRLPPRSLEPGEKMSVSFALSVMRAAAETAPGSGRWLPIFLLPGEYSIRVGYPINVAKGVYKEGAIKIQVPAPKGEDAKALDLIERDLPFAMALLRPAYPRDNHLVPRFQQFVERFPESSYADYARFALAHGHLKGINFPRFSDRVPMALAADELSRVISDRYDPELREVVPNGFAYLPNALIFMKQVDPRERENILRRVHREHTDALEWLEEYASLLTASDSLRMKERDILFKPKPFGDPRERMAEIAEEWTAFRKRAPIPRKKGGGGP